jgi:hypothetical protein
MTTFAGKKVICVKAEIVTVERSWRVRLLSWPWRPWVRSEFVATTPIVGPDRCVEIGNVLYCGETFFHQLKQEAQFR